MVQFMVELYGIRMMKPLATSLVSHETSKAPWDEYK